MARTVEQIIEAQLGSNAVKIALLTAENEKLREDLAAKNEPPGRGVVGKASAAPVPPPPGTAMPLHPAPRKERRRGR